MSELSITENLDKGTIKVKFKDIDCEIAIVDFAKLSAKHLKTGMLMSDLIRDYVNGGIMSEPLKLSKVLGLERINIDLYKSPVFRAEILGRNKALDDLDQLSPDVEELARIIYEQQYNRNLNIKSRCPDWKKEAPYVKERFFLLAQEIINKIDVWVVKKG